MIQSPLPFPVPFSWCLHASRKSRWLKRWILKSEAWCSSEVLSGFLVCCYGYGHSWLRVHDASTWNKFWRWATLPRPSSTLDALFPSTSKAGRDGRASKCASVVTLCYGNLTLKSSPSHCSIFMLIHLILTFTCEPKCERFFIRKCFRRLQWWTGQSGSRPGPEPPPWNVWNFHGRQTSVTAGAEDSVFSKDKWCDSVLSVVRGDSRLTLKVI